jgi:hypothetical protein
MSTIYPFLELCKSGDLRLVKARVTPTGRLAPDGEKIITGGMVVGVALPALAVTSPEWTPPLISAFRFNKTFNWGAAIADATSQYATKGDIRKVNPASSISNGFIPNFLVSSIPGAFVDLSYNTLINSNNTPIIQSPTNKTVWISVLSNATGNAMGNTLGNGFKGEPVFPGMSKWGGPVGNFFGNIEGAGIEKGLNKEK